MRESNISRDMLQSNTPMKILTGAKSHKFDGVPCSDAVQEEANCATIASCAEGWLNQYCVN